MAEETTHSIGETVIKDSGERRTFSTGANRDRAAGKGAFNQLPFHALLAVAQVFEVGGQKYTKDNWKLGMPLSEYHSSAVRHAIKAANGWTDEPHEAQCCWNMMCAIETRRLISEGHLPPELDDVRDWLSHEGVAKALAEVKKENEARIAAKEFSL